MKKGTLFLLLLIGLAVVAYLTNPPKEVHQAAAYKKMNQIVENTMSRYGIENKLLSSLGVELSDKFIGELLEKQISSDNYYVLSLTKLNWENESYIIGVGAFNKVYISNKVDDIAQKAIDDYLKNKLNEFVIPGLENIFK